MPIERSFRRIAAPRIESLARSLLEASSLCAIATVSPSGRAHANTAYFAYTRTFEIVWVSETGAGHSRNLDSNRSAAIVVFDSHQRWGRPDRGIQLFGTAGRPRGVRARDAMAVYGRRFRGFVPEENTAYLPYVFRSRRMKLFDETAFGAGVFVTCTVPRDGEVAWERTDVYSAT
jgi:hypothetical protein